MKDRLLHLLSDRQYRAQVMNAVLRMIPLGLKFVLTLYMGKFFELHEIGIYGLVMGSIAIMGVVFGQNFSYIVDRDIVGREKDVALHRIRDQLYLYLANYVVLAFLVAGLWATGVTGQATGVLAFIFVLGVLEGLGTVTYYNLNAMHRQILANALFLVRGGAWIVPVLGLCIFYPELRNAYTVLTAWTIGAAVSLALTLWCWRDMPWKNVMARPVDWPWLVNGLKTSCLIWLGIAGVTIGAYIDRFVVEYFLSTDHVGILTFYFSFTNALLTLMQSGVAAFATPRMVQHHRDGDDTAFAQEMNKARKQIAVSSGLISIGLAVAVPYCGILLDRPEFYDNAPLFWLMLVGMWLRANGDFVANILYARHQDKALWMGNLLFLIPSIGGNIAFVALFGFIGVGYGTVLASAFLFAWRWHNMRIFNRETSPTRVAAQAD